MTQGQFSQGPIVGILQQTAACPRPDMTANTFIPTSRRWRQLTFTIYARTTHLSTVTSELLLYRPSSFLRLTVLTTQTCLMQRG